MIEILSEKNLKALLFIKMQILINNKKDLNTKKEDNFNIIQIRIMEEKEYNSIKKYLITYTEIECLIEILLILDLFKNRIHQKAVLRRMVVRRC